MKRLEKRYRSTIALSMAILSLFMFTVELSAAEPNKTVPSKSKTATVKTPAPVYGGMLRVADQYDGVSIGYPPKLLRVNSSRQSAPAIETLFRTDKTGNASPWLVETFRNDVKGKSVALKLRKGIKFHDGSDFDAEAVKWNLDQAITAKTQGTEKFKSVDVLDNFTVRINLTEWDSTVTSNLSQIAGMIISPTAFKKNGQEWCARNPVGTGPFQFVSWEKDVRTVYKKFDGYWQKGKPYLDGITWTPMADQLTQTFSLKKSEIDVSLWVSGKDVPGLEKDGFVINYGSSGSGTMALIPDSANPKSPFADVRVRRAARHAIDTEAIVKTVYDNLAESANQWSYKNHWGYNPAVVGYPYNPAKAKKLLADAGYPNGFKTKLGYRTNPLDDQVFTAIQNYLKAVGIDADLDPMMTGRYDQIAMQGGKWEGLIINAVSPNPDITAALAARYAGGGPFFNSMLIPEDYAKAIHNAVNAPDFKAKQKWTREAMKLMIDKYALQITVSGRYPFAVSRAVVHNHGIMATPNAGGWTPEDAWLDK
jgi:peptide/nickel transport system substrate-binding protein